MPEESKIRIGTSFQKTGKAGKDDPGHFIAVSFASSPWDYLVDILGKENNFTWSIVDDRVVVWIELQYLRDSSLDKPPRQRKSRAKAKETVQEAPRPGSSPGASNVIKLESNEGPIELINL